jgi:hypothetical protein
VRRRERSRFRPGFERFEPKLLLSAGAARAHAAAVATSAAGVPLATRFALSRITNPTPFNAQLLQPFGQVLVQPGPPPTGKVINVFFVTVRNSTAQTFDASSGFTVGLTGGHNAFPILTGNEQWKPGQVFIFYALTTKYYPVQPAVSAGFVFNFAGSPGIAIPGPSVVFQRVRYNPATFPMVLDHIVTSGPGSRGHLLGLPDTAIWEFTGAKYPYAPAARHKA